MRFENITTLIIIGILALVLMGGLPPLTTKPIERGLKMKLNKNDRVLLHGWQRYTVFSNGSDQITRDFCSESSCDQGHIAIRPVAGQPKTYMAVAHYYDDIENLPAQIPEKVLLDGAPSELAAVIAILKQGHCFASVWVDMGPNEGREYVICGIPKDSTREEETSSKKYDWTDGYKALEKIHICKNHEEDFKSFYLRDVTVEEAE